MDRQDWYNLKSIPASSTRLWPSHCDLAMRIRFNISFGLRLLTRYRSEPYEQCHYRGIKTADRSRSEHNLGENKKGFDSILCSFSRLLNPLGKSHVPRLFHFRLKSSRYHVLQSSHLRMNRHSSLCRFPLPCLPILSIFPLSTHST